MMHRMIAEPIARRTLTTIASMIAWAIPLSAASAQEFAAEVAVLGAPTAEAAARTIHVSGNKVRAETNGPGGTVMVVDVAANTAVLLLPQEKIFVDMRRAGHMNQAFMPVDVDDPCQTWQGRGAANGDDTHWTCRRVGTETVGGRETIKYAASSSKGDDGFVWIDPKLKFMVRSANAAGQGMELRNIHEAPQPPSLFEVPAGYKQQEMPQIMQQMRQPPPGGKTP
jgi:hypothetical protein